MYCLVEIVWLQVSLHGAWYGNKRASHSPAAFAAARYPTEEQRDDHPDQQQHRCHGYFDQDVEDAISVHKSLNSI